MRLIPWHRPTGLMSLQHQMNRLFDDFFTEEGEPAMTWAPAVDVQETEKEVVARAEVPGLEANDIDISVHGDHLVLKGEKKQEQETKGKNWTRVERRYGAFSRTIPLPCAVDLEKTSAEMKKGVLTVHMAKSTEHQPRKIQVKG